GDFYAVRIEFLRTMLARQDMYLHQQPGQPTLVLDRSSAPPLSEVRTVGQFYSQRISVVAGCEFMHLLVDSCNSRLNFLRHARECWHVNLFINGNLFKLLTLGQQHVSLASQLLQLLGESVIFWCQSIA